MLRYAWAAPNTLLGLLAIALTSPGARVALVEGVLESHGPLLGWALAHLVPIPGGAAALTLGHVVLGRDARTLERTRAHERAHVAQYERWGPAFLPTYALASVWAVLRGGHFYRDNAFERAADRAARMG
jgi:hypothetical protein